MASRKQSSYELATEAEGTDAIEGFVDQMAHGLLRIQNKMGVEAAFRQVVRQIEQERDQAIRGLREEIFARLQRLEVRVDRMEEKVVPSETVAGNRESSENEMLEQLEVRMENVEAYSTVFPCVEALIAPQEETSPPGALPIAPSASNASTTSNSTSDSSSLPSTASGLIPTTSSQSTYNSTSNTTLPSTSASISLRLPCASALRATAPGSAGSGTVRESFACYQGAADYDEEHARQRLHLRLREIRAKWEEAKAAPSLHGEQLCVACHIGNVQEVRCLLDSGADINYLNSSGELPLIYAVDRSGADEALVSILLERGADPQAVDCNGMTALHCAAINDHRGRIVDLLLDAEVDVDSRNVFGTTPLHCAAIYKNEVAVRKLLAAGAKKNLVPWDGLQKNKTPFDLATSDAVRDLLR